MARCGLGCGRVSFGTAPAADATQVGDSDLPGVDAAFDRCDGSRADTVALYDFETSPLGGEATGQHPGAVRGTANYEPNTA